MRKIGLKEIVFNERGGWEIDNLTLYYKNEGYEWEIVKLNSACLFNYFLKYEGQYY